MPTIVCPQCNKDDAIQKISAIVNAGKSIGSYSGPSTSHVSVDGKSGTSYGYSYLTGSGMTDLARLLTPPQEPHIPSIIFEGCGTRLALGIAFSGAWLLTLWIGFYISTNNATLGTVWLIIVTILYIWSSIRIGRKARKEAEIKLQPEKTNWDNAIKRWKSLYYCHRNGIIFDPETNETCEPTKLKEFLYQS